ncbi:MAG TPA: MazG-like family protein [Candidatus Hydrogenedentes bacterium]|nr:MazG-like family protein [Candidatus Hydrogenedentota bacterium]
MINVLYCAHKVGIDLSDAVESKIRVNDEKYPVAKSWDSNKKYTEL